MHTILQRHFPIKALLTAILLCWSVAPGQTDTVQSAAAQQGSQVVIEGDTLFFIRASLGPFTAQQRTAAINEKLNLLIKGRRFPSVSVIESASSTNIASDTVIIMAVTEEDAALAGKPRSLLAEEYAAILLERMNVHLERHSAKSLLISSGITVAMLLVGIFLFWVMTKLFPRLYDLVEGWEGTVIRSIRFRSRELVRAENISAVIIILLKGVRLAASLGIIYFFFTYALSLFPWTQHWNVRPVLIGLFLTILTTTAAVVIFKGINTLFHVLSGKIDGWKGTVIKPVKLKTVEVLSVERIAEMLDGGFKILKLLFIALLAYFYITIVFSFFAFTKTWAGILIGYVVDPLWGVIVAFIQYLPNLFFILVIAYVTRYVIKFIKLIFDEVGKGTINLPGFFKDWAEPTYKIVRFLVIAFAGIVIFPYLPGSSSPVFQGISVFLGVLFSLGSTSAIANVIAGVVITYMRPFKIGDRVKIADTMGDVIEKTLLVTRVRTVKNVDITIPNAMVLGSHIINFSSSAEERGLILHTGVTIGYDAPWKKVHELLIAAATATENILGEPKPFVLQTSLDDFYVSYELNAFTDKPNIMAKTYSDLHQNIQDKFNEAGVEIMSPHYSAVRDGNQTTIPEKYLPKSYQAPAFRIFPFGPNFNKSDKQD